MEFRFKQFAVKQSKEVFKIGTDSVLLGSWVKVNDAFKILEIGTGTGVISLMIAQKSNAEILAIDIQDQAVALAQENFAISPWNNRLKVLEFDFLNFPENEKFDCIVSNPPYFENALKSSNKSKMMARHLDYLPIERMASKINVLLSENGCFSVVLPFESFSKLKNELEKYHIFLHRFCEVSSFEHSETIRCLGSFSRNFKEIEKTVMFLYKNPERERSVDYHCLTKEFYL